MKFHQKFIWRPFNGGGSGHHHIDDDFLLLLLLLLVQLVVLVLPGIADQMCFAAYWLL